MFERQNYFTITQVFNRQNYFTITQVLKRQNYFTTTGVFKRQDHFTVTGVLARQNYQSVFYSQLISTKNSLPSVVSTTSPAAVLLTGEPAGDRKTQSHTCRFAWVHKHQLTPVSGTVLCMATIPVLTREETQLNIFLTREETQLNTFYSTCVDRQLLNLVTMPVLTSTENSDLHTSVSMPALTR